MSSLIQEPLLNWISDFRKCPNGMPTGVQYQTIKDVKGRKECKVAKYDNQGFEFFLEIVVFKYQQTVDTLGLDGKVCFAEFRNLLNTAQTTYFDEVLVEHFGKNLSEDEIKALPVDKKPHDMSKENFWKIAVPELIKKITSNDTPGDRIINKLKAGWAAPGHFTPEEVRLRATTMVTLTESFLPRSADCSNLTDDQKKDIIFMASPKAHQKNYVAQTAKKDLKDTTVEQIVTSMTIYHDDDVKNGHPATKKPDYSKKEEKRSSDDTKGKNTGKRHHHRPDKPRRYKSYGDTRHHDRRSPSPRRYYRRYDDRSDRRDYGRRHHDKRGDYKADDGKKPSYQKKDSRREREHAHHVDERDDRLRSRSRSRSRSRTYSRHRSRSNSSRRSCGSQESMGREGAFHLDDDASFDGSSSSSVVRKKDTSGNRIPRKEWSRKNDRREKKRR